MSSLSSTKARNLGDRPLFSRIVLVDLNQRTTEMLIDESKMAINSSSNS